MPYVNDKRIDYDAKLSGFTIDLCKLAREHNMTEFDMNVVLSKFLYGNIQSKIKYKAGKMYKDYK